MNKLKKFFSQISQTVRFKIIVSLSLVILTVGLVEVTYISNHALSVVRDVIVDTRMKNNNQILNSVDQYFGAIDAIASKPGNNIEVNAILHKKYSSLPRAESLSDSYKMQMFLFREVMLQNRDLESALLYNTGENCYYAISNTYLINKNSYYDFSIHDQDFKALTRNDQQHHMATRYISGIRKSGMKVKPRSEYVVTYAIEIVNTSPVPQQCLGTFYLNIDISTFENICRKFAAENNGDYYIVDQNNNIVYCTNTKCIGQPISLYVSKNYYLENTQAAFYNDHSTVFTLSPKSSSSGWRVITASSISSLFGYEDIILQTIRIGIALLILIEIFIIWMITTNFTKPISTIKNNLSKITAGDLTVTFEPTKGELGQVSYMLQEMLDEINQLIHRIYKEETTKRELELHALQNQITPHFIYNTLSRIQWMATIQQADSIANVLSAFSNILSYCMKSTEYFVRVSDEIDFIRNYIEVMNLRLINEFTVVYHIESEVEDCMTLRFLLQPVIENAILHAFNGLDRVGELSISVFQDQDRLVFQLDDNGVGINPEILKKILANHDRTDERASIALRNVQDRIKHHYGEFYGMTIHSTVDHGTSVMITIPFIKEYDNIKKEDIHESQ